LDWPVKERDWVVVGAKIDDMLSLGYRQVGKEFPVFLHPKTNEEYALARMERKVDRGYKGFTFDTSPTVSLESDLERRDLTINAMAEDEDGKLIDPYHGKADLDRKILRHVSPAFAEDPVRILRVGRFMARYAHLGFQVAPETITLMRDMVKAGEVDALVAERVWKEFERALGEKNPDQFFAVLAACEAMPILFPALNLDGYGMQAMNVASDRNASVIVRFAALLYEYPEVAALCNRYRVPNDFKELASLIVRHCAELFAISFMLELHNKSPSNVYEKKFKSETPTEEEINIATRLLNLFYAIDIFRREKRFIDFIEAFSNIASVKNQFIDKDLIIECAKKAKEVPVQELITQGFDGQALADRLKEKRLEAIIGCLAR
jgi:tRNA nucleotidyltransferase (CCA-adding enzyme)